MLGQVRTIDVAALSQPYLRTAPGEETWRFPSTFDWLGYSLRYSPGFYLEPETRRVVFTQPIAEGVWGWLARNKKLVIGATAGLAVLALLKGKR